MRLLLVVLALLRYSFAVRYIKSSSLLTCMDNSSFTATQFDVALYDNGTATVDLSALSTINSNVSAHVELVAYGLSAFKTNISFCDLDYPSVCPFTSGHLEIVGQLFDVSDTYTKQIPGIAYTIPDLDARVRVILYDTSNGDDLACVEAILSNGKTVQTKYAAWPIAAISGLGVITSGVISIIGHSNTAAHIASNSMSLFVYFQSLAITAMMAVARVPPIAAAWAQNFQWSLGIIRLGFIQDIANWYVQATGGTSTDILGPNNLSISVQKTKRSLQEYLASAFHETQMSDHLTLFRRALTISTDDFSQDDLDPDLYTTNEKDSDLNSKILVLRGIQRVSYLAGIEITSLFMTAIMFLLFFAFVMVVCLTLFKAIIEICIRSNIMNEGKFNEYRQQWSSIIKGSLYRLFLLSLPQVSVLCIWELTTRDSAGSVVVAVFLLVVALVLLIQGAIRVFLMGRRSVQQYKNPAYLLFGDGVFLNKFGFLYVQYRATHYYYIVISMTYVFLKSLFVAALQTQGKIQSVIVFAIELIYLIVLCVLRPFMDKRTNAFNIVIGVINFLNAVFFMFFSYIFGQPQIVGSVMGIVYFVLNAVFAAFLLVFTIVTCVLALLSKNPDTRYQPMKDDRVSFIPRHDNKKKDPNALENEEDEYELMALGATAMRGHEHGGKQTAYDEDDSVFDEDSSGFASQGKSHQNTFNSNSNKRDSFYDVEPTQPTSTIVGNPSAFNNYQRTGYQLDNNSSSSFSNPYNKKATSNPYNKTTGYGKDYKSGSRVNFI